MQVSQSKSGLKSQTTIKTRGKIIWAYLSFIQQLTPLQEDDRIGANCCFILKKAGIDSQSRKNRGKPTIPIQTKGIHARALKNKAY